MSNEAGNAGQTVLASPPAAPSSSSSSTHPAAEPGQQRRLLDLPAALLHEVAAAGTPGVRLLLFGTCRAMRDLVLMLFSLRRLRFHLVYSPQTEVMPRHSRLLAALKQSPDIKLYLEGGDDWEHRTCHIMPNDMVAVAPGLAAVKSVEIECLILDTLVPSWLTLTCPNMIRLELINFQFSIVQPSPTIPIPVCGQLKHLVLVDTWDRNDPENYPRWRSTEFLCWQLRLLPNLQTLELRHRDWYEGDEEYEPWSPHLKEQAHSELLECCAAACKQLTELSMDELLVTDGCLETVLGMPSLRRFQCKVFQLQHSHTHRPCSWTHLTFFQELDVTTFACMPQMSLESLQLYAPRGTAAQVIACSDLAATTRAVAAISRCGGVHWGVMVGTGEPARRVEDVWVCADRVGCVPTLPPLLSAFRTSSIRFTRVKVDHQLLAAIKQHLATLPIEMGHGPYTQGFCIRFSDCGFDRDALAGLLPSLPAWVQHVHVDAARLWGLRVTVLADMCSAACRPITVHVERGDTMGAGWEEDVQAAMIAGHQYVQLTGK